MTADPEKDKLVAALKKAIHALENHCQVPPYGPPRSTALWVIGEIQGLLAEVEAGGLPSERVWDSIMYILVDCWDYKDPMSVAVADAMYRCRRYRKAK